MSMNPGAITRSFASMTRAPFFARSVPTAATRPPRTATSASLPALFSFRHDEELPRMRVRGIAVVIAVERLDHKTRLGEEQLGLAAIEVVERRRSADAADRSLVVQ